jgi:FtsZ-binding cell division protein ZapB
MLLSSCKTKLPFPKPAAKALATEERHVLTARIAALLEENNQLLRELASARAEREALERALHALKRNQKRKLFDFPLAEPE